MDTLPQLLSPPQWSLTLGVTGRILVVIAAFSFFASALVSLFAPKIRRSSTISSVCFSIGSSALLVVFAILATLFIANRLEFEYVWGHSDTSHTIPFRIAGIWAGQEGSFLLWASCSALFGMIAVRNTGELRRWFLFVYSIFLCAITSILAYETPFDINTLGGRPVVPESGIGLPPALQNYWVIIHPPVIFLGFGALTVLAAYSFAAMATGRVHEWVPKVRRWAILALTLVGLGLCLGGFWAYETLGWGGFWKWDPVENVSLVPWLFTAALVHGLIVQNTKKRWISANLIMGGLPFLLFVYGTFLTRSGVLNETSVHSFAQMDSVAHKLLLGFLIGSTSIFFGLWVWRALRLQPEDEGSTSKPPKLFNREALYAVGTILLLTIATAAAIGMSVPMVMAIAGKAPKVVDEALYHKTLVWPYVPFMLAMAIGPLVSWRGMGLLQLGQRLFGVVCVSLFILGMVMLGMRFMPWARVMDPRATVPMPFGLAARTIPWTLFLLGLSVAVIVANCWRISELIKRSKMSTAAFLNHIGVAVLMAGLVTSRGLEQEARLLLQDGAHDSGLGYFIQCKGQTGDRFDRENKLTLSFMKGKERWDATPGLYYSKAPDGTENPVVTPFIKRGFFYDLYVALGNPMIDASEPFLIKPGETLKLNGATVTYVKLTTEGEHGAEGMNYGALLEFENEKGKKQVNPKIRVTGSGIETVSAQLDSKLEVALSRIEAPSNTAHVRIKYSKPLYPIEFFYKPLTSLVWLGTAILTIAGFMSAAYRRHREIDLPNGEEEVDEETLGLRSSSV